ncbi:hypothetical protein COV20_06220 [Candidatus Woesearchaeota archaeon CG10_big_fil_rev_8_21_14_0_10_45_16]|nr:MAG: hypothetical protein COV20_06220 [Candidatus Woesearchaeota archaeon CG10_big_fil_rev_8_21_14_0_10_45_16]
MVETILEDITEEDAKKKVINKQAELINALQRKNSLLEKQLKQYKEREEATSLQVTIPAEEENQVRLADVGGLDAVIDKLHEFRYGLAHPTLYDYYVINPPESLFMYGPPGTGKTMIAKALATELETFFVNLRLTDVIDKYVGETEKTLRIILDKSFEAYKKTGRKVLVFLDEAEQLLTKRGYHSHGVMDRAVVTLNDFMDGASGKKEGIILVAATNKIEMVDEALLRAGRFSYVVEIPPPDLKGLEQIFRKQVSLQERRQKQRLGGEAHGIYQELDYRSIAATMHQQGFTGADVHEALAIAARNKIKDFIENDELSASAYLGTDDIMAAVNQRCQQRYLTASGSFSKQRRIGFSNDSG